MKTTVKIATLASLLLFPLSSSCDAKEKLHQGTGTVTKIEKEAGRVELDHGPIKSIGWNNMVMFFDLEKRVLFNNLKVGDKVAFTFFASKDGRHVITKIKQQ